VLLAISAGAGAALVGGCAGGSVLVYLVRHAEKEGAPPGQPPSKDPPLSEVGQRRAAALPGALGGAKLRAVFATEYRRTQDTVRAVAEAQGLEVTVVPASDGAELVRRIRAHAGGEVLVAGHSNTVPEIAKALGVADPPQLGDDDHGDLFVIESRTAGAQLEKRRFDPA
jgi:broad specificity phosphatase PhoE